jgi:hypothetical protein
MNSESGNELLAAKARHMAGQGPPTVERNGDAEANGEQVAHEALVRARQVRVKACQEAVNQALEKHHCTLVAVQQWVNGQPGPLQVSVQPAP